MSNLKIMNSVTRSFHKFGFTLKKHSPEILVVAGVIGTVASAVLACKATTKLNQVLEESKENVEQIHNYVEEHGFTEKYTEEDSKKDLAIVYGQTGLKIAKLYAPAVVLGVASITSIFAGHKILNTRYAATAAAYAAVDQGFKEYRGRVIERFGKELDRELKYNIKAQEIERKVVNEDGSESTTTETVDVFDPNSLSPFSKIFDELNPNYQKNAEDNLFFLRRQQDWANDCLKEKGFLTLNDVYDMLGFDRTKAGMVVGWVYDKEHPVGDNFIDFGLYNTKNPSTRDFINGRERAVIIDFNVDGDIYSLMS